MLRGDVPASAAVPAVRVPALEDVQASADHAPVFQDFCRRERLRFQADAPQDVPHNAVAETTSVTRRPKKAR